MEDRIADPSDPVKYKENVDWLLGLWKKCKCGHPKGWHDTEMWSKDGSCIDHDKEGCNCKGFTVHD